MFPLFYSDTPLPDAAESKKKSSQWSQWLDIVSCGFGMVNNSSLVIFLSEGLEVFYIYNEAVALFYQSKNRCSFNS